MTRPRIVRSHKLRDVRLDGWNDIIAGKWHFRDLAGDRTWFHGWISFDALKWDTERGVLYCGLNSLDGDLLYAFDPKGSSFRSLATDRWTDTFDSKIHRTILKDPADGSIYFATSLLHDVDQQREAAGGKLVRYDPGKDRYDILALPVPHLYVQSIAADFRRRILYGFTYPAEFVFRHDIDSRTTRVLAYVGNSLMLAQPHNGVVDSTGRLWGTYAETRAWDERLSDHPVRIFSYDPDDDSFDWWPIGLPRKSDRTQLISNPDDKDGIEFVVEETRHKVDYGFCDSMCFDNSRYIYAGTVAGVLARIDTFDRRVEKVCHIVSSGRLPALAVGSDGTVYGAGGMSGNTRLFSWKVGTGHVDFVGPIEDTFGERPARIHELAVGNSGTIFLAENDNHVRSSYLWEVSLGSPSSKTRTT